MRNLFERLKPELKQVLVKRYENLPNTLNEITDALENERHYTHLPYWVFSDLRFMSKEAFGDYENHCGNFFI